MDWTWNGRRRRGGSPSRLLLITLEGASWPLALEQSIKMDIAFEGIVFYGPARDIEGIYY